jgi:tetratricopeptide (TPR) repeat protein
VLPGTSGGISSRRYDCSSSARYLRVIAGQTARAIEDLEAVVAQQPENANAHYNLGLVYFDAKDYERALRESKLATKLGFPMEGLRHKLQAAGKWRD